MAQLEELRLSQFRSDLLKLLGEIYSELSALRKTVRPARLFGESPVEELMELLAWLVASRPNVASVAEIRDEARARKRSLIAVSNRVIFRDKLRIRSERAFFNTIGPSETLCRQVGLRCHGWRGQPHVATTLRERYLLEDT